MIRSWRPLRWFKLVIINSPEHFSTHTHRTDTIELGIYFFAPGLLHYPPNFMGAAFFRGTDRAKVIIAEKMYMAEEQDYDFFQVGGSSGLHGIQPKIVEQYLGGKGYLNLNCCRNTGFPGYRYIAEHALKSGKRKYMILYISPFSMWGPGKTLLSKIIYDNYLGSWNFLNLPSLSWRYAVTNLVYHGQFNHKIYLKHTTMISDLKSSAAIIKQLKESKGWLPFSANATKPRGACSPNYFEVMNFFLPEMERFMELARRHNVLFFLIFHPITCEPTMASREVETKIKEFAQKHPEIIVPSELFITWLSRDIDKYFGDNIHMNPEGSICASHRLGKYLQNYIRQHQTSMESQQNHSTEISVPADCSRLEKSASLVPTWSGI